MLARRSQQIHYQPTARLTSEPGQGNGGRGPRQNREQCCLSSYVQQKNRGNLFEFQSTSSSRTEGWTLHPLLPPPLLIIIITPPPSHPTTNLGGGGGGGGLAESSTVHALFYLVLVDVMGKLSLSLSPSLPPSPSLLLSCARDMLMLCTEQLKHA